MELAGHVALITGAAAGAGAGIARRFAADGADVVVADVDVERGEAVAREIGGRFARVDVTVPAQLGALIESVAPDVLVNNAGGGGHIPPHFPEAAPEEWGLVLDLNLRAPMLATQVALRTMTAGGAVVNIASSAGLGLDVHPSPEYAAAKAGLIRFTTTLAGLRRVRVNCLVPGWILTERAERELSRMTAAERADAATPIPLEDIAAAVVRLATDESLAGRVLVLDGGAPPRLLNF